MGNVNQYTDMGMNLVMSYGPKLLLAILTLIVGWIVIGVLDSMLKNVMTKRKMDDSLKSFLHTFLSTILKVMLILSILGMVGIQVTSFIAFLGAAGLAIGMALQGTLQNFAGGVMILIFKPYKVGDLITAQGYTGTVSEIQIFNTILKTVENHTIIIPNSPLATNSLINYSKEPHRRVDILVPVGYDTNLAKFKEVMVQMMTAEAKILKAPTPFISIMEYNVGVYKLLVQCWCRPDDYWDVFFFLNENIKKEFEKNSISFPTPKQFIQMVS